MARIENVLKRYNKDKKIYKIKDLEIDFDKREVKSNGNIVYLTLKEYELFSLLLKNINIALNREYILEKIWGIEKSMTIETRTVDFHIQQLRKKLNLRKEIVTISKIGYRLEI